MRSIEHFNFGWKYIANFADEYIEINLDDSRFEEVMIPHTNIELPYNNFDEKLFQFVSCYRRTFQIQAKDQDKRAILHFDGVMTSAEVFINGTFVCEHRGGYTPFHCDITSYVKIGTDNVLVVKVDSTEREDIPPFGHVIDYLTYGGIYREVRLEFVHDLHVKHMFVKTRNVLTDHTQLDIDLYCFNQTGANREITLEFQLSMGQRIVETFSQLVTMDGVQEQLVNIQKSVKDILLWDSSNPHLYHLLVVVKQGELRLDEYKVRFGFREVSFRPDGFYLNGNRIKLLGLNRHQAFPYVGYAMPASAQIKDAEILKNELGVNMVRLSHYPQSKHFLDRCDELGLFVFSEIPGWQHIGDEGWQQVAVQFVEEMIKKEWNHPSVIIWGVRINESQDNDAFYQETNRVAKALDDTRPTGGVRNFDGSHLFEDVYTYNDFIHRGHNRALYTPKEITKKAVPYMVTEHNGHMFPTKKFDHEAKRVEHALRHLRVVDSMYQDPGIAGAIGWCMTDYNTHRDFGSGDRICYHGVMDMFRIPKYAAAVYASQGGVKTPVLEVLSGMNIGEREAAELEEVYVFTNCDYLKLYKNGEFLGAYSPSKETYQSVPNPPIIITDFIGDLIAKNEAFTPQDTLMVKRILFAIIKYGDKQLPLIYKLQMGWLMFKYKMSYEKAVSLYTTYVANWGAKSLSYEFEGYKDDQLVATTMKGPASSKGLVVLPDSLKLIEAETYDVCRIVIRHVDEYDHVLPFSNEVIMLEVEGAGAIIGPKQVALIGGSIAFWVKSIGKAGDIKVIIRSNRFTEQVVALKVDKVIV